jgi:hypothetical protein
MAVRFFSYGVRFISNLRIYICLITYRLFYRLSVYCFREKCDVFVFRSGLFVKFCDNIDSTLIYI